ncbi:MAG: putative pseudomurein-binding protein, partial [Methanobacteriaceae archaeon 41_258]
MTVDNLNPVNVIVNVQLTYNEISTASKIIANEVSKTGKIPSRVTVGNKSISIDDYLYAAVV